jgi:hypothetical protein
MEETKGFVAITISQEQFFRFQFGTVTALVVLSGFHYSYSYAMGPDLIARFTSIFDVGRENSLPTMFAAMNLLMASVLSFLLYRHCTSRAVPIAHYWAILSVFFLALATDEVAGLHERVNGLQAYTGRLIPLDDAYAWVPYGAVLAGVVFVYFFPFLVKLKRKTSVLMVLSGTIFLTGALGFECLNGWLKYMDYVSDQDFAFFLIKLFEEGFELFGIALFNCVLFELLATDKFKVVVGTDSRLT